MPDLQLRQAEDRRLDVARESNVAEPVAVAFEGSDRNQNCVGGVAALSRRRFIERGGEFAVLPGVGRGSPD